MQNIPSVDLRDFLSDDPKRKQKFVNEIGSAFEDIGFVALKGHFLNDQLVDELYGEIRNFFSPLALCSWLLAFPPTRSKQGKSFA